MGYDIEVMADCASCFGVYKVTGSKGDVHTVSFGGENFVHCTCQGFKFRQDCKHVSEVYREACMYNPQYNDGKAEPKYKPVDYTYDAIIPDEQCPACGGPVVAVRRAV